MKTTRKKSRTLLRRARLIVLLTVVSFMGLAAAFGWTANAIMQ